MKDAYLKYLSPQTLLNRPGSEPAQLQDQLLRIINSPTSKIYFTISGSGLAASGDLGYVYGSTLINGKTDNYLRIWRKEKDDWKIALEVLHP